MEEVLNQRHFLDAPVFFDGLEPVVLGFGGPIVFLIIFVAIHRTKLAKRALILFVLLLYVFSVLTGAALFDVIGNRPSAFVAAFWAPLAYCGLATVLLRIFYKPPEVENSDYDHLIH